MHFQGRPKSASKSQSNVIMSRRARKCKLERKKCSLNVQGTFQSQENISRYSMKFRLHLGANVGGIINPRLIQGQNSDFMITLLLGHVKDGPIKDRGLPKEGSRRSVVKLALDDKLVIGFV